MKYADGTEVAVGDRVRLTNGDLATVVFDVDSGVFDSEFVKSEWEYLRNGIMVETDRGALIHLENLMFELVGDAH